MSQLCYNRSCGQRFDPDNNPEDACIFHPGAPVFHHALKGWSCCKRRTTDFSDFLSIQGCSRGCHNSEKPAEAVRPEVKTSGERKEIGEELKPRGAPYIIQASKPLEQVHWPSGEEPLVRLQQKVSSSLRQTLEKLESKHTDNAEEEGDEVKIGTSCKNGGCPKGMKVMPCRCDWHQTGSQVIISMYAKNPTPDLSYVEANSTTVNINVVFEGDKQFEQKISLWGAVEVKSSVVNLMAAKMEVSLKKAEPIM